MGDKITITLKDREIHGKKVAKLRAEGLTPVVIYGAGIEPVSAQVETNVMEKVFREAGHHAPVHVTIGSKKRIAMIKDVDHDPVKHSIRHVAFHAVKQNQPVEAEVVIRLEGESDSEAAKAGLVILQALDHVVVKALPMDLPEAIEVDVSGLKEAGERVTLADATLPNGVEFVEHEARHYEEDEEKPVFTEQMVASVWEPAALQAANEAPEDERDASDVESENGTEEATNNDVEANNQKDQDS